MQFVFNRGGHADSNGFADAHESELCRALIVREDEVPPFPSEPTWAKEFRYAGPRQRYLTRQLDPTDLSVVLSETWSDYVGDSIYTDYTVDGGIATEQTRYLPGHWQTDVQAATTAFVHTNMLGTTRTFTNDDGAPIADTNRLYTAFGVPVSSPDTPLTRYGYAGKWGYQEHENMPFLHVGARYYDPSLGRFLQRDPIGIMGGANVYEYVWNNPTSLIDPEGTWPRGALEEQKIYEGLRGDGYTPVEASDAMTKSGRDIGGGFLDEMIPWYDPFADHGLYDSDSFEAGMGRATAFMVGCNIKAVRACKWTGRLKNWWRALRPDNPVWKAPEGIYDAFKYKNLVGGKKFLL